MSSIMSQTDEQREAEVERRAQQRVVQLLDSNTLLPDLIATAVERALRRVMADEDLRAKYWEAGYQEFEKHAGRSFSQAIGRRLLNMLVTAALGAAIVWWAVIDSRGK
jgi:hypothetical protein